MRRFLLSFLLWSASVYPQSPGSQSAYDAVDPFIGTAADGNTFPGATIPFGMIQWSPDTRADGWYHYSDKTIRGFSLTHISGAGCPIYADVPILPWVGDLQKNPGSGDYVLSFSHDREQAHPGSYAVEFDNGIRAKLTVSPRSGIGQFIFPPEASRTLIFNAAASATISDPKRKADTSSIEVRSNDEIVGTVHSGGFCGSESNYVLHFAAKFAEPFSFYGTWPGGSGSRTANGHEAGAYVTFSPSADPIILKVGISFVSIENAEANLREEIPGWNFNDILKTAREAWTDVLSRVQAEGGTADQRKIFYTSLYHMLLAPNLFSDRNGDYMGFDAKVRRLPQGQTQFANFSDWDTYRNLIQFHALMFPEQTGEMMQSLVRDAEQSGWLPRWPVANDVSYVMGGDSPAILLSNAYAFGAHSFDTKSALQFMLNGATQPGTGPHGQSQRPYLEDYLAKGYIPSDGDRETAASVTLEYASADFAISRFAAAMGDHASARRLLRSSQNWRNLFDSESGFIRPRFADGKFVGDWDPDRLMPRHKSWDTSNQFGFEEGSTWQYTWMIPHNYAGLFRNIGSSDQVATKLDRFFEKLTGWGVPTFTVTNEPDFCAPYAYMWTGKPERTQDVIDRIRRETFTTKPDGLPGNDDLGATSGVYLWNALGMYPVIPGVGGFVLGTPMFPRVLVQLGNGSTLEIVTKGKGIHVASVELNGKSLLDTWLPLETLSKQHNRLEFTLRADPGGAWGALPENYPPSFDAPVGR